MRRYQWFLALVLCGLGVSGLAMAARQTSTLNICRAWCGSSIGDPDFEHICPEGLHCCLNANCAIMEFATACCDSPNDCNAGTDENGLPTEDCNGDPQ